MLPPKDECLSVLQDAAGCRCYREFLIQICCVEIIDFWIAIELLQNVYHTLPHDDRRDAAKAIYNRYCSNKSERAINVPDRMRRSIKLHLEAGRCDSTVFVEAQQHVYVLLSLDTFARFKESPQYTRYTHLLTSGEKRKLGGGKAMKKLLFKSKNAANVESASAYKGELKPTLSLQNLYHYREYVKQQKKGKDATKSSSSSKRRSRILVSLSFGGVI